MTEKIYYNEKADFDLSFLKDDEFTFSVLIRILQGECRLTITDGGKFVICHSSEPYPVWVWTAADATEEELEYVYRLVSEHFGLGGEYRFNLKYEFADFLLKRADEDGFSLQISTNMLTYSCENPIPPRRASGGCRIANAHDLDEAVALMEGFHNDTGVDKTDIEEYRKKAESLIEAHRLFFWEDEQGECSAMASYSISEDKGTVGNVYTLPNKRRCGYAANLVHAVTLIIKQQKKLPTLYTDADYAASNRCYEGIGYEKRGSLCTVARKKT